MNINKNLLFLRSALTLDATQVTTNYAIDWIKEQNQKINVEVKKIPFNSMKLWGFDETKSILRHETGKFFTIEGIKVKTNWGKVKQWSQPIINQPEIGYLGFVTKEFDGVLHFLLQAKIEPGNVNNVQLSPTLQATKSNYTRAHKGKAPAYLDFFLNAIPSQILLDQLQSEQGARFLRKRNRNIIIKVEEDIKLLDNFIWLTLGQIKSLMSHNNLVNMDTRTVISGIPYGNFDGYQIELFNFFDSKTSKNTIENKFLKSTLLTNHALHTLDDIINYVTKQKCKYELEVESIPLSAIEDWVIEENLIHHKDHKFFNIIAVEVSIENREVVKWTQPMVQPAQEGICAFVCKEIKGVLHFAVQTKLECGNFDIIEFAPTVQCLTGNYKTTVKDELPFLDYVLNAPKNQIIFDTVQSEEGGRFYKEQNRNMMVLAGDEIKVELPENYIWMTINQLQSFIKFNNYINIQARTLLSAINFKKPINA
jgi:oxidase EvaA